MRHMKISNSRERLFPKSKSYLLLMRLQWVIRMSMSVLLAALEKLVKNQTCCLAVWNFVFWKLIADLARVTKNSYCSRFIKIVRYLWAFLKSESQTFLRQWYSFWILSWPAGELHISCKSEHWRTQNVCIYIYPSVVFNWLCKTAGLCEVILRGSNEEYWEGLWMNSRSTIIKTNRAAEKCNKFIISKFLQVKCRPYRY